MMYDVDLLGHGLRQQRRKMGYTIDEFAERIEISSSYLGLIERGQRYMSIGTLFRVLETLGVTLEEILDVEKPQQKGFISEEQMGYGGDVNDEFSISAKDRLLMICRSLQEKECAYFIDLMGAYEEHKRRLEKE